MESADLATSIDEAIKAMPSYAGDHRSVVSPEEHVQLVETAELLEQGVAVPEYSAAYRLFWMWKLQECYTLLAEDIKNRHVRLSLRERLALDEDQDPSKEKSSDDYYRLALATNSRALELRPTGWYTELNHYYTHYVRGMALHNLGRYTEAQPDYLSAMKLAKEALDAVKENDQLHVGDAALILEKAEGWNLDTYMRLLDSESADEVAREFYKRLSQVQGQGNEANFWSLRHGAGGVAGLTSIYLHTREFDKASEACRAVLDKSRYSSNSYSYTMQALMDGLLEDPSKRVKSASSAACLLKDGYNRESNDQNKLFQMIWMLVLADRAEHTKLSTTFMKFQLSRKRIETYWDRVLCSYMYWDSITEEEKTGLWDELPKKFLKRLPKKEREERWSTVPKLTTDKQAELIALVEQEVTRRHRDGELVNDLMNETWFYAGFRDELRARLAEASEDDEQVALAGPLLESAMHAYRMSSSFPGEVYSYELDYARMHLYVLGRELNYQPEVGFEFESTQITSVDPESLAYSRGLVPGEIVSLSIHTALTPTIRNGRPELEHDRYDPQIGDLLQFILKVNGIDRRIDVVVGATSGPDRD